MPIIHAQSPAPEDVERAAEVPEGELDGQDEGDGGGREPENDEEAVAIPQERNHNIANGNPPVGQREAGGRKLYHGEMNGALLTGSTQVEDVQSQ